MGKQDGISWTEPEETRRELGRPGHRALGRILIRMIPAYLLFYGAGILILMRIQTLQPAFRPDYVVITLLFVGNSLFMVFAPWALSNHVPTRVRLGTDTVRIGGIVLPYRRIESIIVETLGDRPVMRILTRRGTRVCGISNEVDLTELEAYLNEHAHPKFEPQPRLHGREISLNWLALFLGICAAIGLLGLIFTPVSLRQASGRGIGRGIASIGMLASVLGGGIGFWMLFRTRSALVIIASLAAIVALVLDWFLLIEPSLKP